MVLCKVFEFDHVNSYADANGVWEWNEAPVDEFKADICPPDGMCLAMGLHSFGQQGAPHIYTQHRTTTGDDGSFVFERVVPGKARIGREIIFMVNEGATAVTSTCRMPANLLSGETTRIELGGTGQPVIGRLHPPNIDDQPKWNFATITIEPYLASPPMPKPPQIPPEVRADSEKQKAWLQKWEQTPEGAEWNAWAAIYQKNQQVRDASPHFWVTVDRDGTFRADDVPPGTYALSIRFNRDGVGTLNNQRFTVPPLPDDRSDVPLDLGDLVLQK